MCGVVRDAADRARLSELGIWRGTFSLPWSDTRKGPRAGSPPSNQKQNQFAGRTHLPHSEWTILQRHND
jgi:hypothetical protein